MPPAVNRSALSLYAHRLVEDGCRFRLHASPEKSPFLYVREIVDGERLRQFSLAPLEWVAREDVISAYERCVDLRPDHFPTLRSLAALYQQSGFRRKALEAWERAISAAPDAATRERIRAAVMSQL